QELRAQLADSVAAKTRLEEETPRLVETAPVRIAGDTSRTPAINFDFEHAQLAALQTKINVLNSQMEQLRKEAASVDQMEVTIMELRRRKELEEANYRRYAASLEHSRISEALGNGKVSNISQI